MAETLDIFPPTLDEAPPDKVLVESLGWQFGTWGAMFVFFALFCGITEHWPGGSEGRGIWGSMAAGGLFSGYEAWRRLHRTAVFPGRRLVGVYRRGALDMTVPYQDVQLYVLHPMNTLKIAIWGVLILTATAALNVVATRTSDRLLAAAATAAVASSLASSIRTRRFCEIFYIPYKKRGRESFMVPKSQRARLLPS
jgi:hypothetical protein